MNLWTDHIILTEKLFNFSQMILFVNIILNCFIYYWAAYEFW